MTAATPRRSIAPLILAVIAALFALAIVVANAGKHPSPTHPPDNRPPKFPTVRATATRT